MKTDESGRRSIPILLVELKIGNDSETSVLSSRVMDLVHSQNGTILQTVSATIIATFNLSKGSVPKQLKHEVSAQKINEQMGVATKILYGECEAIDGNFYPPNRIQFGPFIPRLSELLSHLWSLDFGAIEKF